MIYRVWAPQGLPYFCGGPPWASYGGAINNLSELGTPIGTSISQGEYQMQEIVYEMNKVGAQLAKQAAAEVTKMEPGLISIGLSTLLQTLAVGGYPPRIKPQLNFRFGGGEGGYHCGGYHCGLSPVGYCWCLLVAA